MSLLTPLALAWLLLIPLLVLLYFVRRARTRVEVSNLFLWRAALERRDSRPALERFRSSRQLVLQAIFVMLVALGLAGPAMSCGGAERVAIVVDRSTSMRARHGGGTRLDEATRRAREVIAGLDAGSQIAVIEAGSSPRLVQEPTSDRAEALRRLDTVTPAPESADLDAAVSLAFAAIDPPVTRVVLLTDVSAEIPAGLPAAVHVIRVGSSVPNVAITRARGRLHPGSAFDAQVLVEVANFGSSDVQVPLRVTDGTTTLLETTVRLAPGARHARAVDVVSGPRDVSVQIESDDALPADDTATARVSADPVRVATLGSMTGAVREALKANPRVHLVQPDETAEVVVCAGCGPEARREHLLVLGRRGRAAPSIDGTHPLAAFLDLDDLPGAVTANERDGRRVVEAAFQDAPADQAIPFAIFMANAIDWLGSRASGAADAPDSAAAESDLRERPAARPASAAPSRDAAAERASRPVWRALFVIALAVLAALHAWYPGGRRQKRLRLAAAVAIVACLFSPTLAAGVAGRHVVFVLDVSGSVGPAAREQIARWMAAVSASREDTDLSSLVTFGGDALVEARRARAVDPHRLTTAPDRNGTNVAAALRLARTVGGPGARLVLITDGAETRGNARAEAARLGTEGVAVDTLWPATAAVRPEVLIADVRGPASARAYEPYEIVVDVQSTVSQDVVVELTSAGRERARHPFRAAAGTTSARLTDSSATPGLVRYDVEVSAEYDVVEDNNRAGAIVSVGGPARVLYIGGAAGGHGEAALRAQGFEVNLAAPDSPSLAADALASFDAVVLSNVAAAQVGERQRQALARFVETSGGGLMMTGADASFGPGGWVGTPLEAILPVDMRPPGRRDASDTALVLVLDKSGSMADVENGARKIDSAVRAAVPLVDLFSVSRTLGIIAFDTTPEPIVRLGEPVDARQMLDRLRSLSAGGGTRIAPAVETALDALQRSGARHRHVLLLSDGRSSPEDLTALSALAARQAAALSVVGVGTNADRALLARLAASGGGRAYFPDSMSELSAIFLQEAALAASAWLIEERFTPQPGGDRPHAILRGIETSSIGTVDGYIATSTKPSAELVLASHRRDPLLAVWQRGLGRAGVLTTNLDSDWAADLSRSSAFQQLWAQTLRWLSRPRGYGRLHPEVSVAGDGVRIAADAFTWEGGFLNALDLQAALEPTAGEARAIALTQAAPGRYEAAPIDLAPGFYMARISTPDGGESVVSGFNVSAAPEYATTQVDERLLADISRLTGGRRLGLDDNPFAQAQPEGQGLELRQLLGALALLLFILEAAIGRGVFWRRSPRRQPLQEAA